MGNLLAISLLAAHLVAMNIAAAGPLACAWMVSRPAPESERARRLANLSVAALLIGSALGGFLLLAPNKAMHAALSRFPASTFWFAGAEVLFSLCCLMAIALVVRGGRSRPAWIWIFAIATATNLLYHFPPLMAVIGKLTGNPQWSRDAIIDHPTLLALTSRADILALWLHYILASLAGAAILALCCRNREVVSSNEGVDGRLAGVALALTLLQLPVGSWVLLASTGRARNALMGQDATATLCLAAGILLTVGLLHSLAAIAFGDAEYATRRRAASLFLAIALFMSATLKVSQRSSSARGDAISPTTVSTLSFPAP
jgi:hypothetical protein